VDTDDDDAPVEVVTKTSKTEKKKKMKKNTKRRIKYTLATEDEDNPKDKRLDEESALTHLVFGDDDDYLEELTSAATTDKQVYLNKSMN
jgi:predicted RNA-binding protein